MASQRKILSVVIPVFNKYNFTKACLNDLSKLPSDHEIIVIDNGSSDETQKSLEGSTEIVYYRNPVNVGFAKACNKGYGRSQGSNILFLNNDIRVKSNHTTWTQSLIEKCATGLVGPTMGQLNDELAFIREANETLPGNSYLSGWCIAASREVWSKFYIPRQETRAETVNQSIPQIFSEEFGLAYFEDTDLGFRARKLGVPMQVVSVPVIHFGKQTSQQINTKLLYQQARSIFIKKWLT